MAATSRARAVTSPTARTVRRYHGSYSAAADAVPRVQPHHWCRACSQRTDQQPRAVCNRVNPSAPGSSNTPRARDSCSGSRSTTSPRLAYTDGIGRKVAALSWLTRACSEARLGDATLLHSGVCSHQRPRSLPCYGQRGAHDRKGDIWIARAGPAIAASKRSGLVQIRPRRDGVPRWHGHRSLPAGA